MRNNAVNRSRNSRGSRRNNPRRPRRGQQSSSILRGNTFRVNPDPTSTVDRPWNSVVLSFNTSASGDIPVTVVRDAFRTQVGAGSTTPAIEFRFIQMRAWELTGANLSVQIYDLDQTTFQPHRTQHDEPGRNHWATCGLQWAVSQQVNTFDDANTTNIASVFTSAQSTNILIHLHILWRFGGDPAPTKSIDLIPTFNRLLAIKATEEEDLTALPSLEDSACQA